MEDKRDNFRFIKNKKQIMVTMDYFVTKVQVKWSIWTPRGRFRLAIYVSEKKNWECMKCK